MSAAPSGQSTCTKSSRNAARDDWDAKKSDGSVPGAGTNEDVEGGTEATGEGAPEVEDEKS